MVAFNPGAFLESLSVCADKHINLAEAAIALAALEHPEISTDRYFHHLEKLAGETAEVYQAQRASGEAEARVMLSALSQAIAEKNAYHGNQQAPDDLQDANLIRVIDRRVGSPVALAIIYINTGRALGWHIDGLDFPGYFLCRIEMRGQRIIFNPSEGARGLDAGDLRAMLKTVYGAHAELSSAYFEPVSNRSILLALQNKIKYRLIEMEDYEGALQTVERMRLVDPDEFRLLLDAGVLYARTGHVPKAISALEKYLTKASRAQDRREAALLLEELRARQY